MRTATQMGPETRPINLFYGLSQGARAVAAALDPDPRSWHLRGHGIEHAGSLDKPIAGIQIQNSSEERGSFTRIASLLGSSSLPQPTELGAILAALPLTMPSSTWSHLPRAVLVERMPQPSGGDTGTRDIFARTQGWTMHPTVGTADLAARRESLKTQIADHYPSLRGVEPLPDGHERFEIGADDLQFVFRVELDRPLTSDTMREVVLHSRTQTVANGEFAFPAFGGSSKPCHPMIILWASLWTMSMLARYEPVRWAKTLDVNKSQDAVALEELLEDALTMVPWLLAEALRSPCG